MKTSLKWIGVIPGSFICGYFAFYLVGWIININLKQWIEPYPLLPSKLLGTFAFSITVVNISYNLAPLFKKAVGIIMGILLVLMGITGYILSFNEAQIGNKILTLNAGGAPIITYILGAIFGMILIHFKSRDDSMIDQDN